LIPDAYFDRFDTPKYRSRNPVQRLLIRRFAAAIHDLFLDACPVSSSLEVGVGEGFLSGYLSEKFPAIRFAGVDLAEGDVARARAHFPRLDARVGSAYDLSAAGGPYDLVICCEVLEHLDDPGRALDQIVAQRPRRVILSVPHEPFFMLSNLARGKNVTRLGNDVDHVNHWGRRSFRRLVETRLAIERLTTSYPWILALGSPR
jgi:2-polyprenyl-3-methyl-5-hydroxy-6-metoxy-1,4-benzoquinol methylase